MNRTLLGATLAVAATTALASVAVAEDMTIKGALTDVFGHRIVIDAGNGKKHLVNLGPKAGEMTSLKAGDTVTVAGDLKRSGEIRAERVTLSDGREIKVGGGRQSWRQWLLGEEKKFSTPFAATDARQRAVEKGYTLTTEPVAYRRHFTAMATKDGAASEIKIHRDGRIESNKPFQAADAKLLITGKGYTLVGEPEQKQKHFEGLAQKDAGFVEIHAHRDGRVVEHRKVEKGDRRWGTRIQ